MSARLDTLTSIKVCQQVVDSGSFMRAADRLDMATATLIAASLSIPFPAGIEHIAPTAPP